MLKKVAWLTALAVLCGLAFWGFKELYIYPPSLEGVELERYQSIEASGFDQSKLALLTQYLETQGTTTGLVVLYKGKVVYEYGDVAEVSYLASVRKSVLSMLYGIHVTNGTIDLQETIASIGVDEADGLLDSERTATVADIITSRSGVFHVASNGGYDEKNFLERGSVEPGSYFVYNNWDFNVAGHLFEVKTGRGIYQELESQLAIPLGFQDWNIRNQKKYHNPENSRYPAYHMYLSTRDMAKIGQLMLNGGEWNGQQLVPAEWIRKTTSTVTPTEVVNVRYGRSESSEVQFSYGYMWWLVEVLHDNAAATGGFSADGYGGQWITVFPAADVVIAHKSRLNPLAALGLISGGTSPDTYWKLVNQILEASPRRSWSNRPLSLSQPHNAEGDHLLLPGTARRVVDT